MLVSVAKIMPQKNQLPILQTLPHLPGRFVAIIAGPLIKAGPLHDRDRAYLGETRSFIAQNNLERRVHLVDGFVEVQDYMKADDLYMMPAWNEGFGTPMLEALGCGFLVIANKAEPAFREWIKPPENGQQIRAEGLFEATTDFDRLRETRSRLSAGEDFHTAFSPEREDPGNRDFTTANIPKIVRADTDHETELSAAYYQNFLQTVIPVAGSRTAEAVKLAENIFRAVNIALVNELKVIHTKMGIDIRKVIAEDKTKSFGYMPFYPGPGMGGHCIPIYPFYLSWKAREIDTPTRFIELAGEINSAMPYHICDEVLKILGREKSMAVKGAKILVLGVSYKKNVNDQRESPAFPIIDRLQQWGADISYYDPHAPRITSVRSYPDLAGGQSMQNVEQACRDSDLALLLTDHDSLPYHAIAAQARLIVDTRNSFAARGLTQHHIFKA